MAPLPPERHTSAMAASLLEVFRTLASFDPPKISLADAPWEDYADWAIGQGLAPLAAYNLEYRLGTKTGAPEWVRDRLLAIYQGSVNDNVMKLVNFKRAVDELEGRQVIMLGGGSFAESLYPHVAFRPVIDIRLLVPRADLDPFVGYLRRAEFKAGEGGAEGTLRELSDGRTTLFVHGELLKQGDEGLFTRALPMKVYGPSLRRLDLEDALLCQVLLMSRDGFDVPLIEFVDLRELVQGAPSMGGVYSRPVDAEAVRARAAEWKMERALWAALGIVERLFPETSAAVAHLKPQSLLMPTRELLERLVIAPVSIVGRTHQFRGEDALRTLLAGG